MNQTKWLTADDLLALGDECHAELVEGRLVPLYVEGDPMSPASHVHGRVAMEIGFRLTAFVRAHRLGRTYTAETGFRLRRNPDTGRAPDFAFVARGRITAAMEQNPYLDLAPDLVVEVVSLGDRPAAVAKKVREYLAAGVRLMVVAYPERRAFAVHHPDRTSRTLTESDEFSGEDVLPGFTCHVGEFFPDPFD